MTPLDGVRAEWLTVVGERRIWASIGLTVTDDGLVPLFGTSLQIVDGAEPGLVGWALSGADSRDAPGTATSIDGLATEFVEPSPPTFADHRIGASSLDHVVVSTPDLERTSGAIAEATGHELKRIRDLGKLRQGFHRMGRGGLIVELVEHADAPPGPAAFWGLVLIVDDLDDACATIGSESISPPKDAVQPGRRIATVRADVGLGVPVALMSPDSSR